MAGVARDNSKDSKETQVKIYCSVAESRLRLFLPIIKPTRVNGKAILYEMQAGVAHDKDIT